MPVGTAGINGAGLSLRRMKHFAAGFIAAGTGIAEKGAGGTIRSADGQPQDFTLLCLAEILQHQTVGAVQPMPQQVIRNIPVRGWARPIDGA